MKPLGFLIGREDSLKSFGMSLEPLYSILSLILFLAFNATSIMMLGLKVTCSSELVNSSVRGFLEIKSYLSLYSWLIIFLSWLLSSIIFLRLAPSKLSMRKRKYFYVLSSCSSVYAISGGINTFLLAVLPGRIVSCEGGNWRDLLLMFFSETLDHFSAFPNILVPAIAIASVTWFTYLLFRIHRISFGLSISDSLFFSLGFTFVFLFLSIILIGLASLIILSLP